MPSTCYVYVLLCKPVCVFVCVSWCRFCLLLWQGTSYQQHLCHFKFLAKLIFCYNFNTTCATLCVCVCVCVCECDSAFDCFTWPFCLALFLPVVFVNTCINIYVGGSAGEGSVSFLYYVVGPKTRLA